MEPSEERSRLVYTRDFLREALRIGLVDEPTYARLREVLESRWNALRIAEPVMEGGTAPGQALPPPPPRLPSPVGRPLPGTRPRPRPARPMPPRPAGPPRWVQYGRRVRAMVASDLGIHGLAYLGVLLVFAGTFGLVFFSLEDVRRDLRPLAEAAIPIAFFLSAWFLRRRGAPLVSMGIELVGGALLPVVLVAAFVDKAAVPPDPAGPPLALAMAGASAAVALAYAWWGARHTGSPLRYLAGPVAWLAVATLGFLFKNDEALTGVAIQRPVAIQMGMATVAVAITLLVTRVKPDHPVVRPTRVAAVPGLVAAYILTVLLAATQGWSPASLITAGVGAVIALELLAGHVGIGPAFAVPVVQSVVVAVAVSSLAGRWGVAAGGSAGAFAYLGLFEWQRWRRTALAARLLALAGIGTGLAISLAEPWAALSTWSGVAAWAHLRRRIPRPRALPERWLTGAAALLPVGVACGLVWVLPNGVAWVVMAAILSALGPAARRLMARDQFWGWWLPIAAVAVAAGVRTSQVNDPALSRWELAAAAGLATFAIALAPRWRAVRSWSVARLWAGAATAALSLSIGFDAASLPNALRPLGWGLAGALALVSASVWRRDAAGHLSLIGLTVTLAALAAPASDAVRVGTLATWTGAWLAVVAGREALPGDDPLVALGTRAAGRLRPRSGRSLQQAASLLPPLALVASLPFLVVRAASLSNAFERHRSWSGVALASTALVYAAAARMLSRRRPLAPILAAGAVAVASIGIAIAAPSSWPTIGSVTASIAVVWLMGGRLRRPFMTVFAWAMSGLLAVLLAAEAGTPIRSLNLVSLGWGAALLVGGLALDELRAGRRRAGDGIRVGWLVHPVAIGAVAVPASLAPVFTYDSTTFGWWMAGAGALYLIVALELRAGGVSGAAYALGTAAFVALLPWSPMERPWILAPWAALLVGASSAAGWMAGRRQRERDGWLRWDLAPLLVAHAVAGLALVRAVDVGTVPDTWAAVGGLCLAISLVRRHWAWAAAGMALILVASGQAGPGWLAGTLAATSAGSIVAAVRTSGWIRSVLQAVGIGAAGWAWGQTIIATSWSANQAVGASAIAFGGLALVVGMLAREVRLGRDWVSWWGGLAAVGTAAVAAATIDPDGVRYVDDMLPAIGLLLFAGGSALGARHLGLSPVRWLTVVAVGWGWVEAVAGLGWPAQKWVPVTALASGGLVAATTLALRMGKLSRAWTVPWYGLGAVGVAVAWGAVPLVERRLGGLSAAGGFALLGCAAAVAARPLGIPRLREATSVLALACGAMLLYGLSASASTQVGAAAGSGFGAMVGSVALWRRDPDSSWLPPLALFSIGASTASIPIAATDWPHRTPLLAALIVTGSEAAAAGITLRRTTPLYLSPVLLCAAWLIYASEAVRGNPESFTVPVGLALLALVELARSDRRRARKHPVTLVLVILELSGVGFLVGAALVQIVTTHVAYGLLAVGLGGVLIGWGGLTRVRRRCAAGAIVGFIATLLMLSAPIAHNLPRFRGASLWITVAVVGGVLLLVAGLLEQGQEKVKHTVRRLGELMEGWE